MRIGALSEKYEGGGPATVSTGAGDAGGVSYGTYQLAANTGSVRSFIGWLLERNDFGKDYGNALNAFEPGSSAFSEKWKDLAETDPEGFGNLQDEYVLPSYYEPAIEVLKERGVSADTLPDALKAVVFSNSIQHGYYNAGELVADSYDESPEEWIRKIYDTKIL